MRRILVADADKFICCLDYVYSVRCGGRLAPSERRGAPGVKPSLVSGIQWTLPSASLI